MDTILLENISILQTKLKSTSSHIIKKNILKEFIVDDDLKKLIKLVYDPDMIFNITSKKIIDFDKEKTTRKYKLFDLLHALSDRQITGHLALYSVKNYINEYKDYRQILLNIFDKDLKIGMNVKQINKTSPGLIDIFSVALAENFDSKTTKSIDSGDWFVSRKLDGVRCICIIKNGIVKFYSRTGKEFHTLGILTKSLENLEDVVLDGEVALIDGEIENFSMIMKEIRNKNHTIKNPKYYIFDTLSIDEFISGTSIRLLSKRYDDKPTIISNKIEYLENFSYTPEVLSDLLISVESNNWEGLMLRKDNIYKGKRSKDILKVKKFHDKEFIVKDIEIGTMRSYVEETRTYVDIKTLGAVLISYKGNIVKVGSGFSMDERKNFFKNPSLIIGKTITVKYFEETKNKKGDYSLRFPIFKALFVTV
jgi:DNA ligase-1